MTLRALFALSAKHGCFLKAGDVETAFLTAKMDCEVWVTIPTFWDRQMAWLPVFVNLHVRAAFFEVFQNSPRLEPFLWLLEDFWLDSHPRINLSFWIARSKNLPPSHFGLTILSSCIRLTAGRLSSSTCASGSRFLCLASWKLSWGWPSTTHLSLGACLSHKRILYRRSLNAPVWRTATRALLRARRTMCGPRKTAQLRRPSTAHWLHSLTSSPTGLGPILHTQWINFVSLWVTWRNALAGSQTPHLGLKYDFQAPPQVGLHGYTDASFTDCPDSGKSTIGYVFYYDAQ